MLVLPDCSDRRLGMLNPQGLVGWLWSSGECLLGFWPWTSDTAYWSHQLASWPWELAVEEANGL